MGRQQNWRLPIESIWVFTQLMFGLNIGLLVFFKIKPEVYSKLKARIESPYTQY